MDYDLETIDFFSKEHMGLYEGVAQLTRSINDTYSGHNKWLFEKFFPGLKDGSRKMVVAYNELNNPMGVALLKDTDDEKKICCLFVREDCRGKGLAGLLMSKSCEALKTDKPLITVADRNISQLQRLLDKHNFKFSYKKTGAYQENDTENYFNNEATELLKTKILNPLITRANKKGLAD